MARKLNGKWGGPHRQTLALADRLVNIERDCETKGQGMIQLLG